MEITQPRAPTVIIDGPAIGLSLGETTGYAINPARDLGRRTAHSLLPLGKEAGTGWSYAPVPLIVHF
jgi:glycerol uptake facilitator protein